MAKDSAEAGRYRREVEGLYQELASIREPIDRADAEDDSKRLMLSELKDLGHQLKHWLEDVGNTCGAMARLEADPTKATKDREDKTKMTGECRRLQRTVCNFILAYDAEELLHDVSSKLDRLERRRREDKTAIIDRTVTDISLKLDLVRANLIEANLQKTHHLWREYESFTDRMFILQESPPPIPKEYSKSPSKGPYKIADLAIPKFHGKLKQWIPFWAQFKHAVHKKVDIEDEIKMIYLKQAVTDPGLSTTIEDLGIEDGAYDEAVRILKNRFDRPRLLHKLYCENMKNLSTNLDTRKSLTEFADKLQHIYTGFKKLESLDISEVLTSMAELVASEHLRKEWLKDTKKIETTPPIDDMIAYIRELANQLDGEEITTYPKRSFDTGRNKKQFQKKKGSGLAAPVITSSTTPSVISNSENQLARPTQVAKPAVVTRHTPAANTEYIPPKYNCPLCGEHHYAFHCPTFKGLAVAQRKEHVNTNSLCNNCLKPNHKAEVCKSTYRCRECKGKHSSFLHEDQGIASPVLSYPIASTIAKDGLVMTANVMVTGTNGTTITARAFLDSGSTVSLISNNLKRSLALKSSGGSLCVSGVGDFEDDTPNPLVNVTLSSTYLPNWKQEITAVALPKVIKNLPLRDASSVTQMSHLQLQNLADPLYYKPGPIDMILGQNIFPDLFMNGRTTGPPNTPTAWETVFGWTVMGLYPDEHPSLAVSASAHFVESDPSDVASDSLLMRFWKSEEPPTLDTPLTPEEERIEKHFDETHKYIKEEQRYMVSLPKTPAKIQLGSNERQALHRGENNEKSLIRNERYDDFQKVVKEYITLGHARLISHDEYLATKDQSYFMPLHAVFKSSSTTTKVRAVFDASAKTDSGFSLNDMLAVGPTLQPTLDQTLLRFRLYTIAISGDISKMYREILLSPEDRPLHRFLWRENTSQPWQVYEMQRVTFGVTSSPYVAIKTLTQTAKDFGNDYPNAKHHIESSFYVDDCFAGAATPTEAITLRTELTDILSQGGFNIRKWRSNSKKVISTIPPESLEILPHQSLIDSHSAAYPKALGLIWDSQKDEIATHVEVSQKYKTTKRGVVSDIAKTFDVLGWLAPVVLTVKILYRTLWERKIDWDQQIPEDLKKQYQEWRDELPKLANIRLPRHYFNGRKPISISLHGFSDASQLAFSAVVYVRATYESGLPTSLLVIAKTRVAPLDTRSIPELELCGAHLVAKLLKSTSKTLNIPQEQIWAYSDSTVVLAWLDGNPKRYKIYVANRIAKTVKLMPPETWHHVPTALNPADCASRGITAEELINHPLWWHGPPWLRKHPLILPPKPGTTEYQKQQDKLQKNKKQEEQICCAILPTETINLETCSNSLAKVIKVTCWVRRFVARLQKKEVAPTRQLTLNEIAEAEVFLQKRSQRRSFSLELTQMQSSPPKPLSSKCRILALQPKLNSQGLLVVGGRLQHADISEEKKHPVILSPKDVYTKLLFSKYHHDLMHGGPTIMLSHSGEMFHVIGAKKLARQICQSCVTCRRVAAKAGPQVMGQLPSSRLNPDYAFFHVGLDFAGPYLIREGYIRRPTRIKTYLAVFVCFKTKAVHLEIVKDASTESLISCLKRFCSRRGRPLVIHSDNGTNFIGAKNDLAELYSTLQTEKTQNTINSYLLQQKVSWETIPVKAPHFGGLWEAAVKSAKFHLKRVLGEQAFTYDELETMICEVEACLNSRPLGALASHPMDGTVPLTPGHFLIGRPIKAYPVTKINYDPPPSLRWAHCQKMIQLFWSRWSREYLQQLQRAVKWHKKKNNYCIGDMVLVNDGTEYLCQWTLAKVIQVYPGNDGCVRAVDVQIVHKIVPTKYNSKEEFLRKLKTRISVSRRPVAKLSMLLAADEIPTEYILSEDVPAIEDVQKQRFSPPQDVMTSS